MQIEWMGVHKKNVYRVGHNGKVSKIYITYDVG